jgi:hypothetical protein
MEIISYIVLIMVGQGTLSAMLCFIGSRKIPDSGNDFLKMLFLPYLIMNWDKYKYKY